MVFKYCNFLSVIFVCLMFLSSYAAEDTSREKVEQGVRYIAEQDAERIRLFKIRNRDPKISDHTQNIYALLRDPEKVSIIHYATPAEKETIFKAVIASAILHVPVVDLDYPSYLDFYESKLGLLEVIFFILQPKRVDIVKEESLAKDISEFFNKYERKNISGVTSAEPYFCHIQNLFDKDGQSLMPKFDSLVRHFEIIIALNRFAKAVVKDIEKNVEMNDGHFDNCIMLLNYSGINIQQLFLWFREEYARCKDLTLDSNQRFNQIITRCSRYMNDNKSIKGSYDYRSAGFGDHFIGHDHDREFNFGSSIEAGGGGDCGYFSLGIKRSEFVDFLKTYEFPASGPTLEEAYMRAYNALPTSLRSSFANPGDSDITKEALVDLYSKNLAWMTLEDFRLVSSVPSIVSNRNNIALNRQIIYLWSFIDQKPSNLKLVGAYYNGEDVWANETLFRELLRNNTAEQHVYYLPGHFQQLNPR